MFINLKLNKSGFQSFNVGTITFRSFCQLKYVDESRHFLTGRNCRYNYHGYWQDNS